MKEEEGSYKVKCVKLLSESPLLLLPTLAKEIGINEAILLQQMKFWITKSKHVHNGRLWIYNSAKEWLEQLPFFSRRTLERTITNLKKMGLIEVGNFNKLAMDRTRWFAVNEDHEIITKLESKL